MLLAIDETVFFAGWGWWERVCLEWRGKTVVNPGGGEGGFVNPDSGHCFVCLALKGTYLLRTSFV